MCDAAVMCPLSVGVGPRVSAWFLSSVYSMVLHDPRCLLACKSANTASPAFAKLTYVVS